MKRLPLPLLLILIAYLIIGTLYAAYTPAWEAPDEPAHYNYIRQLAAGQLPIIEQGDYDQAYINKVVFEAHFDPVYDIEPISYEDWQPPLYYLLLTPIFWISDGSLLVLRLASLLFGAGIILFAFAIAQHIFPKRPYLAYTTAVFVAFLPQHIAIMAALNNDSLAELLIAATLWQLLHLEQWPPQAEGRKLVRLGLCLGLGLLTKATVYLLVPLIGIIILRLYWRRWQQLWRVGWLIFAPAALLGSLWWGRNLIVYGGLDIMATAAHDAIVVGQPRTADWIINNGLVATFTRFRQFTFNSFWGQFGWMTILMPTAIYRLLTLFTGGVVIGVLLYGWQNRGKHQPITTLPSLILLLLFLLTLALYIGYNITFVQHQGRYLFPALIPISIGVALGLAGWLHLLTKRGQHLQHLLPIGLGIGLYTLAMWALFRVIVPNL